MNSNYFLLLCVDFGLGYTKYKSKKLDPNLTFNYLLYRKV